MTTTRIYNIQSIFDTSSEHGEGPIWDETTQKLYWVDLLKGILYKGDPNSSHVEQRTIGQPIGSMAIREKGGLVMAVRDGFGFFNEDTFKFELLKNSPEKDNTKVRFNDGAVDPSGRFFAGTMEWNGNDNSGKLFRLNQDHNFVQLDDEFIIPNGMGWNSNKNIYYVIDTFRHALFAYDYDLQTGEISNQRIHIKFKTNEFPDGMAIDTKDGFWIAMWGGSKIIHFDKNGEKVKEIPLPITYPTSCCFGGSEMKSLFITTSKISLTPDEIIKNPNAGKVFKLETEVQGRIETKYKG